MRDQYKVLQERYSGISESEDYDPKDTKSFYKRFDALMKGYPGLNYFLKYIERVFDITSEEPGEAYHVLAAYWEQWYDNYVKKVKVSSQEAQRLADLNIAGLYDKFLTSPEGEEWKTIEQARPEYEKGAKETGWDIQNTISEDEQSSQEYDSVEDFQYYKDTVSGLLQKPGFQFFFKWFARTEGIQIHPQYRGDENFTEYFLNSVENYTEGLASDSQYDDLTDQEKDMEAIDRAEQRILREYNLFLKDKKSPEYKAWKEYKAVKGAYKGAEQETGWDISNIM